MNLDTTRVIGIALFPHESRGDATIDERHRAMRARLQAQRQFAHSCPSATGAGMSLALACDITITSTGAVLWPSFAHLGLVPDAGVTFRLARRIGGGQSLAALLLSEKIDAPKAREWGLAYAIVPAADVLVQAHSIARRLAAGPQTVLGQIRHLHASAFDNSLREQMRAERSAQEMLGDSRDCVEGVRAFFEKREPNFESHRAQGMT
jgi:2-(1,2-epoxy-1,2-dihydrophenyl)acetyl-CoA isomerase